VESSTTKVTQNAPDYNVASSSGEDSEPGEEIQNNDQMGDRTTEIMMLGMDSTQNISPKGKNK
jgi:hypothetical protein